MSLPDKYIIGIDLGTTNIVVAYSRVGEKEIHLFKIPQIVQLGKIAELAMMPSVRYMDEQVAKYPDLYALPWGDSVPLIGAYAKELAIENPTNAVISPKSWLAHPVLDISQKCLPIGSTNDEVKVSPIDAIKEQLEYIENAWNYKFDKDLFNHQHVTVTIPASFDDQAREVIRQILIAQGIKDFKLLEEPQAAFYYWLSEHDDFTSIRVEKEVRSLALVCDVGGGTTDFSIILLKLSSNNIEFERVAVGEHLLLGGDNMDLLLSRYLQQKYMLDLKPGQSSQWMIQVRSAKEKLLRGDGIKKADVTILSRGSRLFKKAQKYEVTTEEISKILIDGFIPTVPFCKFIKKNKLGLRRIGLPYENETAITQHLANFLIDNQDIMRKALGENEMSGQAIPEVVLFNGGVFYSSEIKQRIINVIQNWKSDEIDALVNTSPSLAVAKGAVYCTQARNGTGVQISSSAPTNYFLKVGEHKFICILPIGSVEDELYEIDQKFKMLVGQAVLFELYTSKNIQASKGEVIQEHGLSKLSETILKIDADNNLDVRLNVKYSSVGVLLVEAVDAENNIYPLSFSLKQNQKKLSSTAKVNKNEPIDEERIKAVINCFFKQEGIIPLKNQLETVIGAQQTWTLITLRKLGDLLLPLYSQSRRSELHEKHWWNLLGYCLRPGQGDKLDTYRIETLWQKYAHGVQYQHQQNLAEFWVCWRRVSSGLSVGMQEKIFNDIKAIIYTRKDQLNKKQLLGYLEKMRLIAALEKLSIGKRIDIGNYLIRQILKKVEDHLLWWMLGRVANRVLFANGADVIPPEQVEAWLDKLFNVEVDRKFQPSAVKSIALMVQKTKDPLVDISIEKFALISTKLTTWKASKETLTFIQGEMRNNSEMNLYAMGEELPVGLVLLGA